MGHKKGFNDYIIDNDTTILKVKTRKFGDLEILIDTEDLQMLIDLNYRWYVTYDAATETFYAKSGIYRGRDSNGKRLSNKTITMHRIILRDKDKRDVDHINFNTLDNRKSNLRYVEYHENHKHRNGRNKNNKSGCRNVCWIEGWWRIQLQIEGKNHLFPEKFKDLHEAGKFAEEMRLKYYGIYSGIS
jgi:hypothetical protein